MRWIRTPPKILPYQIAQNVGAGGTLDAVAEDFVSKVDALAAPHRKTGNAYTTKISRSDFPSKAGIIIEDRVVDIYDGDPRHSEKGNPYRNLVAIEYGHDKVKGLKVVTRALGAM